MADISGYRCHISDFLLGFCHKENHLKPEFQQNMRSNALVPAAIVKIHNTVRNVNIINVIIMLHCFYRQMHMMNRPESLALFFQAV